mgnify:CR=1 FL=1|jgi:hypothetical protein
MIILSGKIIPTDIEEFNQLEHLYSNSTKDEIGHQVSKIAAGRLKNSIEKKLQQQTKKMMNNIAGALAQAPKPIKES